MTFVHPNINKENDRKTLQAQQLHSHKTHYVGLTSMCLVWVELLCTGSASITSPLINTTKVARLFSNPFLILSNPKQTWEEMGRKILTKKKKVLMFSISSKVSKMLLLSYLSRAILSFRLQLWNQEMHFYTLIGRLWEMLWQSDDIRSDHVITSVIILHMIILMENNNFHRGY